MRGAINLQSACNQHAISGHHRNQRLHTLTGTQHAISCHPSLSAVTYVEGHAERQARSSAIKCNHVKSCAIIVR
jgi:hypothetical protein